MSLSLIHEIWTVLKPSLQTGDVDEAAEMLVNYLVDNDYDPSDIRSMFKRESEVQEAISYFLESPGDEFTKYDEEEEDDDYYEDEDDSDYY